MIPYGRIPFAISSLDETCAPLFELRWIQPFQGFPEGPDGNISKALMDGAIHPAPAGYQILSDALAPLVK